ncbi:hypothetical protein [Microbacterium sp. GXF7504]
MSDQLQQLVDTLAVDGFRMSVDRADDSAVVVVTADEGVCGDCLVPRSVMMSYLGSALELDASRITLQYPADAPH